MIKMRKLLSIMLALSLLILSSCHTTKQAKKAIKKVMKYHPEVVANVCIDSFPCITSKIDTVINVEYEFIEIQCPGINNVKKDTIHVTHTNTKIIKGPSVIATEYRTNTITKIIKDSAEIISCKYKCDQLQQENNKLKSMVDRKNKWITWLIIAFLLSIIGNILQLKK